MRVTGSHVVFARETESESLCVTVARLDMDYYDYERLLDQACPIQFETSRDGLLEALKRVGIMTTSTDFAGVGLAMHTGGVKVSSAKSGDGHHAVEALPGRLTGTDEITMHFSLERLTRIIAGCEEDVTLEITDPRGNAVIRDDAGGLMMISALNPRVATSA